MGEVLREGFSITNAASPLARTGVAPSVEIGI
jgi:hypothetical protein